MVVEVAERNGDTGATAKVALALGGTTLGPVDVTVAAGGRASATFTGVTLPAPTETTLLATVSDAAPAETDAANNTAQRRSTSREHELPTPRNVLFPSLGGYGAQFGMHVYAPITPWPAGVAYGDFEMQGEGASSRTSSGSSTTTTGTRNADGLVPRLATNYALVR